MVEKFVESKRESTPPRKKAAKKTRTPAEIAAAKASKRVDEMEAAAIAVEAAAYESTCSGHAAEQEEDDSAAELDHAHSYPPSTGTSVAPASARNTPAKIARKNTPTTTGSSIYHRENASRHGHRDRDMHFHDDRMGEEDDHHQPSMFRAAAQTDARDFFSNKTTKLGPLFCKLLLVLNFLGVFSLISSFARLGLSRETGLPWVSKRIIKVNPVRNYHRLNLLYF
jgi:hypothetical protein